MVDAAYLIDIKVGALSFEVSSADPYDPTDTINVLDSLKIGWAFSTSDPFPSQPDPVQCRFELATLDASNLRDELIKGVPVQIRCHENADGSGPLFASFAGRIGTCDASYVRRASGDATVFTVVAVDYTVDLAEVPLAPFSWPADATGLARSERIDAAIVAAGGLPFFSQLLNYGYEALESASTNALAVVNHHLAQDVFNTTRYYVRPYTVLDSLTPSPFLVGAIYDNSLGTDEAPGRLVLSGGLLSLTIEPGPGVVSSSIVELENLQWVSDKERGVNHVVVSRPTTGQVVTEGHGARDVRLALETDTDDASVGDEVMYRMADLYLPAPDEATGWQLKGIRFDASADPAVVADWFPDHTEDGIAPEDRWPGTAVVISDLPDAVNLAGDTGVYAGRLASAALVVSGRRVLVECDLRRDLVANNSPAASVVSYDYTDTTWPTVKYSIGADVVNPALTFYDARLLGRP